MDQYERKVSRMREDDKVKKSSRNLVDLKEKLLCFSIDLKDSESEK